MLTLLGRRHRFCDGIDRRDFLHLGLGLGGLSLAGILQSRALGSPAAKARPKSIIFIRLNGGPSHIDMYDLKPNAPVEVRGEFQPIHTNVPGFDICELFPLQATIADRLALVRTVVFQQDQHAHSEVYTGMPPAVRPTTCPPQDEQARRPAFGSIVSRLRSTADDPMPHYVDCTEGAEKRRWSLYAGSEHEPFIFHPGTGNQQLKNLEPPQGANLKRLHDRKQLLQSFDSFRRRTEAQLDAGQFGPIQARALEMITSGKVREAFDLTREPEEVRRRFGKGTLSEQGSGDPRHYSLEPFLLARRLVEAGVSVVTVGMSAGWDMHANIMPALRSQLPILDQGLYSLLTDLHERGLDQDTAVVMLGEFGRTPQIDKKSAGRGHWPQNGFVLFSGGGLRMGQVIGESDARGEHPKTRRLSYQNVLATCYHVLGIDTAQCLNDCSVSAQMAQGGR